MPKKDPKMFLSNIQEAIESIFTFIQGFTYEDFVDDLKTNQASIRLLEVIGEAIKNVPLEIREMNPEIAWQEFAGMRDKLIHQYFGVDLNIVWDTINNDLPVLKDDISRILQVMDESNLP